MGSLPNLHELGKNDGDDQGYKPGPALGHLCGGTEGAGRNENNKIYRYNTHNKITKARSNPHDSSRIIYDDVMVEHMATYSPISSRSRYNLNMHNIMRRRDSMNSSIGATSVRRLLAVVRGGVHGNQSGRNIGYVFTKRVLITNLIVICLSHLLFSAAYMPFLALQSSVSVWSEPSSDISVDIKKGSFFLSIAYAVAAIFALVAPIVLRRVNGSVVIVLCYGLMIIFYLLHLHPTLYVTIPCCVLLGIIQGLLSGAHISFLMTLSQRITGLFHEEDEENRQARRTCVIRRVARAFQASQDIGLIVGSIISSLLIVYTVNITTGGYVYDNSTIAADNGDYNISSSKPYCHNCTTLVMISPSNFFDYNTLLDDIFDRSDDDYRLCGAQACPITVSSINQTLGDNGFRILPLRTAVFLVAVYAGACGAALLLGCLGLDKIKLLIFQDLSEKGEIALFRALRESFRDPRLQMAAPLALFIGIEQAFIYADFSKSYVVCTLGIHRLNLVFLSKGILQSIAALTLSMLLRSIRRYYVVGVGFTFQGCLLMVLILWKPTEDDPALFYVISAAWGVCNAIWEMLSFTFLTGNYAEIWDTPFAMMAFFKFCGLSIAFILHGLLCNICKLYAIGICLVIAVVSFAWLEIRLEHKRKIKNITRL